MSDAENDIKLREALLAIDDDEAVNGKLTDWECDFIESVCFNYDGPLSDRQRAAAKRIIEAYGK